MLRSNVIRVRYRSTNPEWARRLLGTVVDEYLERRTEVYQLTGTVDFFQERAQASELRMQNAEADLEEYLAQVELSVLEQQGDDHPLAAHKDMTLRKASDFDVQLKQAEVSVGELQRRVAALEASLAAEPERLASANRSNLAPEAEEIQRHHAALLVERDRLIQDYSAENRKVQDVDRQLGLASERLGEFAGGISGTEPNTVHSALRLELSRAQADLAAARSRRAALAPQLAGIREELELLTRESFRVGTLYRELTLAREAYLRYSRKHEEASISRAMDQEKMVNVIVAWEPRVPAEPVTPNKGRNMIVALFVGAFGGIGLVFGREHFDHSLSTPQEVERRLGVRTLAFIADRRGSKHG